MTRYTDEEFAELKEQIEIWHEQFEESDFFSELNKVEQRESYFIVDSFADFMYTNFVLKPEQWDKARTRECCISILPRKISAGEEYFRAIPGVLTAFFKFLAKQSILDNEKELIATVQELGEQIVDNANNSENVGAAKSFFESAEDSGIGIADEEEVDQLINLYNQEKEGEQEDHLINGEEEQPAYNLAKEKLLSKLVEFFEEVEGGYQFEVADFYGYFAEVMGVNLEAELSADIELLLEFLLIFDYQLEAGQTVVDLFREQNWELLSEKEKEILEECLELPVGLYLVEECWGEEYLLQDIMREEELLLTSKEVSFSERELILGRIAKIGTEYQLVGPHDTIPIDYKELLLDDLKDSFIRYQQETGSNDLNEFLQAWGVNLFSLFMNIRRLLKEEQDIRVVYEAEYSIQSRSLAKKRLLSQENIIEDDSAAETDFLVWTSEERGRVCGNFIIDDESIFLRTHLQDKFAAGKELIEDLLLFTATFKKEYEVDLETGKIIGGLDNRSKEESRSLVEAFINDPLNPIEKFDGKTPLELSQEERGRKQLRDYVEKLELIANFVEDSEVNFFNLTEIDLLKEKLNLDFGGNTVFQDGVEELIIEKNEGELQGELCCDIILLWRDYKSRKKEIRGQDKSWAAAVEYLFAKMNNWSATQKEVGAKYGVSSNTISKKYRQIAETLEI
ncbi:hypothetical protein [Fuchsiella alkaliacetigena]|uniref:hypothetical protein n=1 Tax=Fuchsiella alkaliacetigena TaxID=957042 RepID=UPI00200B8662|nr:hypothetical protein [Fuchsiella alkaliacetigena]MCK8823585.1 hypothetical protein [Fuchsiella alkaliacetigena]